MVVANEYVDQEKVKHLETRTFSGTTDLNCSS